MGSLLQNIAYIGYREVNKIYKDEDADHLKPWQKHQTVKAAWPAIISEKLFSDAQRLLSEAAGKERTRLAKTEKRIFLYTGLITCGETGLPLVGQTGHGSSGKIYRYYHYVRKPKNLSNVRPRLNADEIEAKIFEELITALKSQNFFSDLEKTFRAHITENSTSNVSELERVRKELKEANGKTSNIWANQGRMALSEEALKFASEELNRLAKQKSDLEKYLEQLGSIENSHESPRDQALFVENQIRWCLQGWAKAPPAVRKRMLRRTIKEIIVTRNELNIIFWKSTEERGNSIESTSEISAEDGGKIIALRRRSPRAPDQNLSIISSGKVNIGRE